MEQKSSSSTIEWKEEPATTASSSNEEPDDAKALPSPGDAIATPDSTLLAATSSFAQYAREHASSRLANLPSEILIMIFQHVKEVTFTRPPAHCRQRRFRIPGIDSIRLTCWDFCRLSSHLLVDAVTVELQPRSLARLEAISRHPDVRLGVRRVRVSLCHYQSRLAADPIHFARYCRARVTECLLHPHGTKPRAMYPSDSASARTDDLWLKGSTMSGNWGTMDPPDPGDLRYYEIEAHRAVLRRAYAEYQARFRDQEALQRDDFCRRVAAALSRMPLARNLQFDNRVDEVDVLNLYNMSRNDDIVRMIAAPTSWRDAVDAGLGGASPAEPLFMILSALHGAGVAPTDLTIELPAATNSGFSPSAADRANVRAAMRNLKTFRYDAQIHKAHFLPRGFNPQIEFMAAVLDAPSLERIEIAGPESERPLDFGPVLAARPWPRLKRVSLRGVAIGPADLERFLRHCSSSSSSSSPPARTPLRMEHVQLLSGTWARVLDILRDLRSLFVELMEPQGAEYRDAARARDSNLVLQVHAYIDKRQDRNPLS